jgi:hypothetical protein
MRLHRLPSHPRMALDEALVGAMTADPSCEPAIRQAREHLRRVLWMLEAVDLAQQSDSLHNIKLTLRDTGLMLTQSYTQVVALIVQLRTKGQPPQESTMLQPPEPWPGPPEDVNTKGQPPPHEMPPDRLTFGPPTNAYHADSGVVKVGTEGQPPQEGGWDAETVKRQVTDFNTLCDTIRDLRQQLAKAQQARETERISNDG